MGMVDDIITDLTAELQITDENFNADLLAIKVASAYREVVTARKYPSAYEAESIEQDMLRYYSNVRDIALYDYNMVGAENEQSHSENGITRNFSKRDSLFSGVIPLAR